MFVERLTEEQVKEFLDEQYDKDYFKCEFHKSERITGKAEFLNNSDEDDIFWLSDFEVILTISVSMERNWIKYLYKIFGEEYKEAYLAECAKIFK